MEKIIKEKNFNNFVWAPLGSKVNIYINFCLQVHFKVSAGWNCSHYLPQVSLTPVANLPPVSLIPVAICVVDTGGKFAAGVNSTRGTGGKIWRRCRWYRWLICCRCRWYWWQICRRCCWYRRQICHRCRWHWWCTLTCEYLREFSKKFETVLMGYSGAGGKLIHKKNQKQKISWHCPFKCCLRILWMCVHMLPAYSSHTTYEYD